MSTFHAKASVCSIFLREHFRLTSTLGAWSMVKMALPFVSATSPLVPDYIIASWTLHRLFIAIRCLKLFSFRLKTEMLTTRVTNVFFTDNRHDKIPFISNYLTSHRQAKYMTRN